MRCPALGFAGVGRGSAGSQSVPVGRLMLPLDFSVDEVQQLKSFAQPPLPYSIVQSTQIVLACGTGEAITVLA